MLEIGRHDRLDDIEQACRGEQLPELTLADAGQIRLVMGTWVELARRSPEEAERTEAAGMVPDAGRDDPA